MNNLYYACVGGLIICFLTLSFSNTMMNNVAIMNIIFLYTFGTISGMLIAFLYYNPKLEKEQDWVDKKVDALEKKYYDQDQSRLAYIHKIQIEKDQLQKDYDDLTNDVANNLGLNESEQDIAFGGTD